MAEKNGLSQSERDALVLNNQRLVIHLVKRARSNNQAIRERLSYEDCISAGNLALTRAATMYDPTRGVKFSTYASWAIRHELAEAYQSEGGVISIPSRRVEPDSYLYKFRQAALYVLSIGGSRVRSSSDAFEEPPMMPTLVDEKSKPRDRSEVVADDRIAFVREGASYLAGRDRVIYEYLLQGMTLAEIGSKLLISKERVRQKRDRIARVLREVYDEMAI